MLENKFFEVFESDAPDIRMVLDALRIGTEKHLREIIVHLDKEKMGADFERKTA